MKFSDVKRSPMEKHLLEIIDYLKNKEDSSAGFMSKIENALQHARYLEERTENLTIENHELREKCRMPLPILDFKMETVADIIHDVKWFQWKMQIFGYRNKIPVPPLAMFNAENEKFWKLVRRQSYKSFIKLFRKTFDENFQTFLSNYK